MELSVHRLRMVEGVGQSFCSKALSSCALSFCKLFSSSPESICTRPVGDHVCNYKKGGHIVNRVISRGIQRQSIMTVILCGRRNISQYLAPLEGESCCSAQCR